jgi:hypothetical protein
MASPDAFERYRRALRARRLSLESQKLYAGTIAMLHKQTGDAWPTYPDLVDWLSSMDISKTTMHHRTANVKRFFACPAVGAASWRLSRREDRLGYRSGQRRGRSSAAQLSPCPAQTCGRSILARRRPTGSWQGGYCTDRSRPGRPLSSQETSSYQVRPVALRGLGDGHIKGIERRTSSSSQAGP